MAPRLFDKIIDGPIDIVGDVHGEIDALRDLLAHLGYTLSGEHPTGRRLVFVGDLCDRGPDSPAVIHAVRNLVERGFAQCLLGNHEINLLRGVPKNGNGWFFARDHDRERGQFTASTPISEHDRVVFQEFFSSLPIVLERPDLRLVHAAWVPQYIEHVAEYDGELNAEALYRRYEEQIKAKLEAEGLKEPAEREYQQFGALLTDSRASVPLLPATSVVDEIYQMSNPVRVLTSGVERRATQPYFANGKWRMVERLAWWHSYTESVPVIVGHYWRWFTEDARVELSKGEADLFAEGAPHEWLGPHRNVYCVDFSVGGRFKERELGRVGQWKTRLAAVRWPEREVVFDDGQRLLMS